MIQREFDLNEVLRSYATAHETSELFAQCLAHVQDPTASPLPNRVVAWVKETQESMERISKAQDKPKFEAGRFPIARRAIALIMIGLLSVGIATYAIVRSLSDRKDQSASDAKNPPYQWQPSSTESPKVVPQTQEINWESGEADMQSPKQEAESFETQLKSSMPASAPSVTDDAKLLPKEYLPFQGTWRVVTAETERRNKTDCLK